ncbi:MAG: zinc ribbon domain-containing protein [Bacillota bacterium]
MAMQSFTRNYQDHSTEAGFEFVFDCDICGDGFKTSFVECRSYKRGSFFKTLSDGISAGARLVGLHNVAYSVDQGSHIASRRFDGMTPEWHKEHEAAFQKAMNEAKEHFHRCHGCQKWVCDACINDEEGLCVECVPRENIVVARARSERLVEEVREKASTANVFHGDIESRQITCPNCGKPVAQGKFCNNCGASVALAVCSNCGAQNQQGVKFCSECGARMGSPTCPECGAENVPGAKFCNECGAKQG